MIIESDFWEFLLESESDWILDMLNCMKFVLFGSLLFQKYLVEEWEVADFLEG